MANEEQPHRQEEEEKRAGEEEEELEEEELETEDIPDAYGALSLPSPAQRLRADSTITDAKAGPQNPLPPRARPLPPSPGLPGSALSPATNISAK